MQTIFTEWSQHNFAGFEPVDEWLINSKTSQHTARILTSLVVTEICLYNLVVKPQMRDNHSVLSQRARFIRADHCCRS